MGVICRTLMTRLKFLVFALPTLGLVAYLVYLSPGVTERVADQASVGLSGAPAAVALRLESQRSDLQAAIIRLAASPAALNPGPKSLTGKVEAPTAERLAAVRQVLLDGLPEAHRAALAVGVVNESGSLFALGAGDPGPAPEGLDLPAVAAAAMPAGVGTLSSLNGAPTLFYATPLLVSERNEVKVGGSVVVGLPLLADAKALAEVVARELRLEAVGIVSGGVMLGSAGPQKSLADQALKTLKVNTVAALGQGPVHSLGPLNWPMLTAPLPLETALRREIAGSPYEVVAVVSSRASIAALASFQIYAVSTGGALLLLAIVVLMLLGAGDDEVHMSVPLPMPVPPIARANANAETTALGLPEVHPPAEASPDDFEFPASSASAVRAPPTDNGPGDPFATVGAQVSAPSYPSQAIGQTTYVPSPAAPPMFTPPAPPGAPGPSMNVFDDSEEASRTVAYPSARPSVGGLDPFAMASSQSFDDERDVNNDSTRVAAVPKELIQAARGGPIDAPPARVPMGSMPKVSSPVANDEEKHFQDVFREFIATRERCKEPADGLTFDKFKQKLLRNKDTLVAKYNCRTVRFQVYVKDGKAALKATPVKD